MAELSPQICAIYKGCLPTSGGGGPDPKTPLASYAPAWQYVILHN